MGVGRCRSAPLEGWTDIAGHRPSPLAIVSELKHLIHFAQDIGLYYFILGKPRFHAARNTYNERSR